MTRHHHSLADEATSAGLLGATTVAVWFLLLDFIAGRPLHIASVLGQVLLFGRRTPELGYLDWPAVETRAQLDAVRGPARATWLLYTFPVFLESRHPEVWNAVHSEFATVRVFRGTIGDGGIYVCRAEGK